MRLFWLLSSSEFIVDEECILQLFKTCRECNRLCTVKKQVKGLKLVISQKCSFCESRWTWTNLPDDDEGNLQINWKRCSAWMDQLSNVYQLRWYHEWGICSSFFKPVIQCCTGLLDIWLLSFREKQPSSTEAAVMGWNILLSFSRKTFQLFFVQMSSIKSSIFWCFSILVPICIQNTK